MFLLCKMWTQRQQPASSSYSTVQHSKLPVPVAVNCKSILHLLFGVVSYTDARSSKSEPVFVVRPNLVRLLFHHLLLWCRNFGGLAWTPYKFTSTVTHHDVIHDVYRMTSPHALQLLQQQLAADYAVRAVCKLCRYSAQVWGRLRA